MKARWLSAAALMTLATVAGLAGTGCEDPVDITPSDNAVGTTQTTGADISTGAASASDTSGTINNVGSASDSQNQQPQANVQGQQDQAPSQQQAQSYTPAPPQQPQQSQQQPAQPQTAPADTSGYGTLPMPNAETQVGSYSANTIINQGGTGSVVTDMSGAPPQNASGSNVNPANAPNAYSTGTSNAITNAGPAGAAAIIGAAGTANDLAPADPRSSQSVYNAGATQAPVTSQMRTGAYSATPVQYTRAR